MYWLTLRGGNGRQILLLTKELQRLRADDAREAQGELGGEKVQRLEIEREEGLEERQPTQHVAKYGRGNEPALAGVAAAQGVEGDLLGVRVAEQSAQGDQRRPQDRVIHSYEQTVGRGVRRLGVAGRLNGGEHRIGERGDGARGVGEDARERVELAGARRLRRSAKVRMFSSFQPTLVSTNGRSRPTAALIAPSPAATGGGRE